MSHDDDILEVTVPPAVCAVLDEWAGNPACLPPPGVIAFYKMLAAPGEQAKQAVRGELSNLYYIADMVARINPIAAERTKARTVIEWVSPMVPNDVAWMRQAEAART